MSMDTNSATESTHPRLNVTVVGHTNTGKTSLIRTMLRSADFGEIEDAAGTTRHVEQATISADHEPILDLHDTPGLEDSTALQARLQKISKKSRDLNAIQVLEQFATTITDDDPLEQEAKVIRQILRSHVLLYMIDVREPVLEKYLIEIEILSKSSRPIIPVFNFIADHAEELAQWRTKLATYNIHTALEFDTVAFTFEAEKRLYQKMQTQVESHYEPLQKLIDYRADIWDQLCLSGAKRVVELIVTVACYRESQNKQDNAANENPATSHLQNFIRQSEQRCLKDLLAIFNFSEDDVTLQNIPVSNGEWQLDLFAPGILKAYGLDAGSAALKGAAAGAGIDLIVGGLSLGAASALGAAAGAGWSTFKRYGEEIKAKIQGTEWICADENTLSVLYLRQQHLLQTLMHRGHAAQDAVEIKSNDTTQLPDDWSALTSVLRQNPAWQMASGERDSNPDYQTLVKQLEQQLLK